MNGSMPTSPTGAEYGSESDDVLVVDPIGSEPDDGFGFASARLGPAQRAPEPPPAPKRGQLPDAIRNAARHHPPTQPIDQIRARPYRSRRRRRRRPRPRKPTITIPDIPTYPLHTPPDDIIKLYIDRYVAMRGELMHAKRECSRLWGCLVEQQQKLEALQAAGETGETTGLELLVQKSSVLNSPSDPEM